MRKPVTANDAVWLSNFLAREAEQPGLKANHKADLEYARDVANRLWEELQLLQRK